LDIRSDSELMVRQINGEYRVKSTELKPLYERAVGALAGFQRWRIVHVRRERNGRADELANLAMDRGGDVVITSVAAGAVVASGDKRGACGRFVVRLQGDPGERCVAEWDHQAGFVFSGVTPEGCCVHAAAAAIGVMTGSEKGKGLCRSGAVCRECGVKILIEGG
jgi:hypothetical protein